MRLRSLSVVPVSEGEGESELQFGRLSPTVRAQSEAEQFASRRVRMHVRRLLLFGSCVLGAAMFAADIPASAFAATPSPQQNKNGRPEGGQPGNKRPAPGTRPGGRPGGQQGRPGSQPNRPPQGGNKPAPNRPQPNRPNPGRPAPNRPSPGRPGGNHRPPPRPVNRPHYNFGDGGNGFRLRRYFNSDMARINRARRPHFLAGGYFPRQYVTYLQPIPPDVLGYLPPVPPGYAIGYYDGYTVVYDPTTYLIASVLDLFRY
jgi:hypothetical protein